MPRLIFKCPYIKGGTSSATAHLENYVKYMATRNGVERIDPGRSEWPATSKQKKMVEQILRDFPLSRGMFEYEDYAAEPTRTNASEFITRALEDNYSRCFIFRRITMNRVLRIDEEKPEMHISVQGYKVTLCFAEKENPEVAVLVKQALLSAYAMPQK